MEAPSVSLSERLSPRVFFALNAVISGSALALLAYLLLGQDTDGAAPQTLSFMPAVNATFNAVSAVLIVVGRRFARRGLRETHKRLMLSALAASALFLVGYLVYHAVHGDTRYPGTGLMRTVYLSVLASHVILSVFVLPLVLTSLFFALRGSYDRHRKWARVTFPIWLYVSVTGVLIFFMLRAATPALPPA
jgi:putative membrane protein